LRPHPVRGVRDLVDAVLDRHVVPSDVLRGVRHRERAVVVVLDARLHWLARLVNKVFLISFFWKNTITERFRLLAAFRLLLGVNLNTCLFAFRIGDLDAKSRITGVAGVNFELDGQGCGQSGLSNPFSAALYLAGIVSRQHSQPEGAPRHFLVGVLDHHLVVSFFGGSPLGLVGSVSVVNQLDVFLNSSWSLNGYIQWCDSCFGAVNSKFLWNLSSYSIANTRSTALNLARVDLVGDVHCERASDDVLAPVRDCDVIVSGGGREILDVACSVGGVCACYLRVGRSLDRKTETTASGTSGVHGKLGSLVGSSLLESRSVSFDAGRVATFFDFDFLGAVRKGFLFKVDHDGVGSFFVRHIFCLVRSVLIVHKFDWHVLA